MPEMSLPMSDVYVQRLIQPLIIFSEHQVKIKTNQMIYSNLSISTLIF